MTTLMGVLNVTPDSFSDGGRHCSEDAAFEYALAMLTDGADFIDVGGESTRPGAQPVPVEVEQSRVLGVISRLAGQGATVSVDTLHADTAVRAAQCGATIINDVSGGLADPGMFQAVAATGLTYILGHWRGTPQTMNDYAEYRDPLAEVTTELRERVHLARLAGIRQDRIILDPGLGFAKNPDHNWTLLAGLDRLRELGYPVMVGASRKRFLGNLLPEGSPVIDRDLPTAVITVLAAQAGAWAVRVHNVAPSRLALNALAAWQAGSVQLGA